MELKVNRKILNNGLNILVVPIHNIPKVSIQLWYKVGSKDEKTGQKGIAHFIEHMIFKGTETLSECDIKEITHKLSGYCNAFTSYDYTGYLFDFPSQHWHEALPIMADCMQNCTFREQFLISELKAVIQELKLYKDDYTSSISEHLVSAIFTDHPYHHPIIGYKQDLWHLDSKVLMDFYKYHYIPNNATLIVVGDVEIDDVFNQSEKSFENAKPNWHYQRSQFYHSQDLISKEVTIYRDVKQPEIIMAWVVPGAKEKENYLIDIVSLVIGSGRGSRLYKKLVDELALVTEIDMFNYDLFEYGVLFLYFEPKRISHIPKIVQIINDELANIIGKELKENEIFRAIKKIEVDYLALLEDNQKQAYEIAKNFLVTNDENYFYKYTEYPKENLNEKVKNFISNFMRPSITHMGKVLPLEDQEKKYWIALQQISDQEDEKILSKKVRDVKLEEGQCVYSIEVIPQKKFKFPQIQTLYLDNGLKILYYDNPRLHKIDLIIDFKAKYYYDPENKQGLGLFVYSMLEEGTKNYSSSEFADTLESYGMKLTSDAGLVALSMLSEDLAKGLELLSEIFTQVTFKESAIERVRDQMITELNQFWDQPLYFATQLVKQEVYKNHPYSKNKYGNLESLKSISRQDLIDYYKTYVNPTLARLAISGDLEQYEIKEYFDHMLFSWKGAEINNLIFPSLEFLTAKEINYPMMRDQVVLCYGGLSVSRLNSDYDRLLLFDQIFTGGVLGSMNSRLFDVRERTGLFYTIGGSLLYQVDKEPGMILIKTLVSNDRLAEAEKELENEINTAIDTVTETDFFEAQQALINSLVDNFSTNYAIANTALLRDLYDLPTDYFEKRADDFSRITIEDMQQVVRKYLNTDKLVKVRVGRV